MKPVYKRLCLILALGLAPAGHGLAREALVPLPSVFDLTGGDGWGVGLGAGVEYEAAYDGSDEYEFEAEPAGAVQWRRGDNLYFWEGLELGWRGLAAKRWLLQAGIRRESGLEEDDSDDGRLDGIDDRDDYSVGFFEARRALDADWRNWIGARLMGGPSDFGWLGVLAAGHRFGRQMDGSGSEIFLFTTFGSDEFINKDFGVSAEDAANSGLEEIELDGGYRSIGLSFVHRRDLSESLHLRAEAGYELYSGDIQDSDIAREDFEAEIGAALIWLF